MNKPVLWKFLVPLAIGVGLCLMPVPQGLQPAAWFYFAVFAAVVTGLVLEPIPAAAIGIMGVTLSAVLLLVDPKPAGSLRWALSGFSNSIVWLIFIAFMFAKGYENTGLGRRIGLHLVRLLGKDTLGLGYAIALADLVIAPFTPSVTARSGGTIYPIIKNIPPLYDSYPGESGRKIGSCLMWVAVSTACITSSMFLTALAPNLLAIDLLAKVAKINLSWMDWFLGVLPVGLILFLLNPYLSYKIYPPQIRTSDDVPAWASAELAKMGPMGRKEITMAVLAVLALILWIFGAELFKLDATVVALMVFCAMILLHVISWDDVVTNKAAWNVLVWFGTLVTLADGLKLVKFLDWFATSAAGAMQGLPIAAILLSLVVIFFLVHYMFASLTAHTTALLPVFMAAAIAVPDMPVKIIAMMFCFSLGIMGVISPYAAGQSPIFFGSGYLPSKDFWRLGLIFGAIYLCVLLGVGYPYLTMIVRI
ncbi:anion permease [Propionivibrio dicarboxylicus]|uniref:L-tartrate/succinate antiporter n=1 Tax=Propionivibrio dicarboxylicus TaxID=83767 RepID=A0A1G7XUC5_9RHOO|nr:anion permease [Propionivibrio dicarboxylicus]SDG87633.1 L-tartrate/succinate antiporter [Propionivibrio dicarboxylicus]